MGLKIGLLLPSSDMFPSLALDFLNGLKLVLDKFNNSPNSPQFIIEGIGNATDDTLIRVAEKMILQENVDVTVSFCGIFKLKELVTIFNSYKKPLIHIDLGSNVLQQEHISPYVIHHSLNLCESSYASGVYATKTYGKNAALAVSFYDEGYHLTESFVKGFTNNGGNIIYTYVSPMDYKSETFETLLQDIENSKPDVIFTLFSYKESIKVFETLSNSNLNSKIPFLASPLMTDESINIKNYEIEDVHSIASWAFEEDSPEMKKFISDYKIKQEDFPNIISLLGYEIGLTLAYCLTIENRIPLKIGEYLHKLTIVTPRGKLTYNNYNESQITQFKLLKFEYHNTNYKNTVIETLDTSFTENLNQKLKDIVYSGWQNPYVCT